MTAKAALDAASRGKQKLRAQYFEKRNEPILMPRDKDIKQSALGSGGQRSGLHDAEDIFGDLAEASFSTPLALRRVGFRVFLPFFISALLLSSAQPAMCQP